VLGLFVQHPSGDSPFYHERWALADGQGGRHGAGDVSFNARRDVQGFTASCPQDEAALRKLREPRRPEPVNLDGCQG
jgi:hypothetical protein